MEIKKKLVFKEDRSLCFPSKNTAQGENYVNARQYQLSHRESGKINYQEMNFLEFVLYGQPDYEGINLKF